jgi:xanthine dehydrogenase accessory factor
MWLKTLNEWRTAGKPCAVVTIIKTEGSSPRGVGSKMVVDKDGRIAGSIGGGPVEHICREEAQKGIKEGRCISLDFSLKGDIWQVTLEKTIQGLCGGTVTVFIEPILPDPEIVIFGGGHIGEKISRYCELLDMPYRLFDNREEFSSPDRFPSAVERIYKPYESLSESLRLTSVSYCVILTHGHQYDETCLEQLLSNKEIPYIGMIGSSIKIETLIDNITSRGGIIDSRLYSPVGLSISNNLPAQIALGIVAQILLLINKGTPDHCRIPWHEQKAAI